MMRSGKTTRWWAAVVCALALPATADWFDGEDYKMHFPQMPNPMGWDVDLLWEPIGDDWECTETGEVTDIHFWTSWRFDMVSEIMMLEVMIFDNDESGPYSKPGSQLWGGVFGAGQFTVIPYGAGPQGWFDPNTGMFEPMNHFEYWQVNIRDIPNPFVQQAGDIYWLVIIVQGVAGPEPVGWKTSLDHYRDIAVYFDFGLNDWAPLELPTGEPLSLAFVITGEGDAEGDSCTNPTPVNANDTTTVVSHGGWFEFVAATNATAIETCGSSFDTVLDVWSADCATVLATNDDCSDGTWGAGSDPNASCYQSPDAGERDSCLCLNTTPGATYKIQVSSFGGTPPPAGSTTVLTLNKQSNCGGVPEYKWLQEPDLSTMGMDVNSSVCYFCHTEPEPAGYLGGHRLGDDFECTERSPITEIHVWGSWQNDYILNGDPTNVDFYLSIHEDIPAKPPAVPYSRPGDEIWGRTFLPGEFTASLYADGIEEWWYQPPHTSDGFAYFPGDTLAYEYVFDLSAAPFYQWGLPERPVTYWLTVEAHPYPLASDSDYFFGWKTSVDHWNDDAVYASAPELLPEPVWHELRYPGAPVADPPHPYAGESIDLAFGIVGGDPVEYSDQVVCEPQPPDHPPNYWYEVDPDTFGRCDFHVRVYDPDPCNYSNWVMPANWVAGVHPVGDETWVSWWDPTPGCKNAFFSTETFGFDNDNPSTWGDWATSIGNSPDPYDPGSIVDTSASHTGEPDGWGYRVHVPSAPAPQPKWVQAPDMSVLGMDVAASRNPQFEHYWNADDFRCTTTGELTEIVVWGSWWQDLYPSGADAVPSPGDSFFDIAIHADVPADQSPTGYSMPGEILWSRQYFPLDFGGGPFEVELCADGLEEGFYEPTYPETGLIFPGDFTCWKYTFTIPDNDPFTQEGTPGQPIIYWLSLQALPFDPPPWGIGDTIFGWKSSIDHWNDDAVYSWRTPFDSPHTDWYEIIYPPTHPLYPQGHPYAGESVDLAFAIIGEIPCTDCYPCDDDDVCTKDDLCDTGGGSCQPSCQIMFADATDNGVVNMADVLACNGSIPGGLCAMPTCDVNPICTGNGVLNTADVLAINGAIGQPDPCNCPPRDCP